MKKKISITVEKSVLNDLDDYIDGVTVRNRSQAIEYLLSRVLKKNRTAVMLATKIDSFRILCNIKGKPLISRTLRMLQSYGFNKLFIVGEKGILSNRQIRFQVMLGFGKGLVV